MQPLVVPDKLWADTRLQQGSGIQYLLGRMALLGPLLGTWVSNPALPRDQMIILDVVQGSTSG